MRFFLKFISCVRRIVLKRFQDDSGSLKVRKESRLRNKFKISSKNQILEGLGKIWFKWVHLIENNELLRPALQHHNHTAHCIVPCSAKKNFPLCFDLTFFLLIRLVSALDMFLVVYPRARNAIYGCFNLQVPENERMMCEDHQKNKVQFACVRNGSTLVSLDLTLTRYESKTRPWIVVEDGVWFLRHPIRDLTCFWAWPTR